MHLKNISAISENTQEKKKRQAFREWKPTTLASVILMVLTPILYFPGGYGVMLHMLGKHKLIRLLAGCLLYLNSTQESSLIATVKVTTNIRFSISTITKDKFCRTLKSANHSLNILHKIIFYP